MPIDAKPLFRPEVIRPRLDGVTLPGDREPLNRWADLLASGKADKLKETELLGEFLGDVFLGLLGYVSAVGGGDRHTYAREQRVKVDGKFADAVLGDFRGDRSRYVAAVEGKGPKDPLERPHAGRKMSAVDQGYRYAINLPCDWIVVTSIRQTRLYHKGADQYTYEAFNTEDLVKDERLLRKFVFLLGADRVVPRNGSCHLDELRDASEKVGRELTRDYYVRYAELREDALDRLRAANPEVPPASVLSCTQKVLDRVLFAAFCEDRGLLPADSIARAYQHADPYNPRPIWENFRGLFRAIDLGNPSLNIPAYNGGLFAEDTRLDALNVPDEVCGVFRDLAEYDYRPASGALGEAETPIDVEILGHIFEQSINDLERLRETLDGRAAPGTREERAGRRRREGAFYTPPFITRTIVGRALGRVLDERFEDLRDRHAEAAPGTVRVALNDPMAYDLATLTKPRRAALVRFWEAWQDEELAAIRVLDPSCGSGAFLVEAFEHLYQAFRRSNDHLEALRGSRPLLDLDRYILQHNLFGVDLNEEAVQICKLSLWIKTTQRDKPLPNLDGSIRVGNSVVSDPEAHPRAFDWHDAFPEVMDRGGFDVVVGNPPYVRQEWIASYKPHLKEHYKTYHGVADLYVYFFELGLRLLRPGGRLSYVVTNKWLKAGYAEPLRGFFASDAWVESVVDFGHAKQIFPDADVFPSILLARKPDAGPAPSSAIVCAIPREQLRVTDLDAQIAAEGVEVDRTRLGADAWSLEPRAVFDLLAKIRDRGVPLAEFAGVKPYYGVKTGFNEAFLIDTPTRDALIAEDPKADAIIKPYLRGQDIERWSPDWAGLWMIFTRRGIDIDAYPSIKRHLSVYRERLEPKPRDWEGKSWPGRKPGAYRWYEIQDTVDYWEHFDRPKILYQDITWRPSFCLDTERKFSNDTTFFIPTRNAWILSCLNSPAIWWYAWRTVYHGKDEALRLKNIFMETFPIPNVHPNIFQASEEAADQLIEITKSVQQTNHDIRHWLEVEYEVAKPSLKLREPAGLDRESFAAEVKKARGKGKPLSLAARKMLDEEYDRTVAPARAMAADAGPLERRLADLVNAAYGLTPEEVALLWSTAPPRMPAAPPVVG